MNSVINFFKLKHSLFLLTAIYLVFRIFFLTKLPIFNDEAIYLDWAWRETHVPGHLFYSLYDAKQPLLMWLFGMSQSILTDPLLAGRIVSVAVGLLSLFGIYKLSNVLLGGKSALLCSVVYISLPIFLFYDRQALMESAMVSTGIWSCYYTIKVIRDNRYTSSAMLGLILGIGYFIKSTALIFLVVSITLLVIQFFRGRQNHEFFRHLGLCLGIFLSTIMLLLIQPEYWRTLGSSKRYVLTLPELFSQSASYWYLKGLQTMKVLLFGVTPFVFIVSLVGMYGVYKQGNPQQRLVLLWLVLAFVLQLTFSRFITARYLVPFLSLFVIFAFLPLQKIRSKTNFTLSYISLLVVPVILSLFQVILPYSYLAYGGVGSNEGYLEGQTSGYGIKETAAFLMNVSEGKEAFVAFAQNAGNPESAMIVYLQKKAGITTGYLDKNSLGDLSQISCLASPMPLYYVSREEQRGGLDSYLEKVRTIRQPTGSYTIGIYQLRKNCTGKTLQLSLINT